MLLANAQVSSTSLARSIGKATKATINALQFLESGSLINILTIRRGG
jgi:hypothetical protein